MVCSQLACSTEEYQMNTDFNLQDLSAEKLYELGRALGSVAKERPDITHRFLLGMRDGLNEVQNGCGYGFGDVFSFLWRRAFHTLSLVPPISF